MTTQEKPNKKTKTLKDLGFTMPIGIADKSGGLQKGFAFKPWRMKEEKELGKLKKELEDSTMPVYVSSVISVMCTKLGPHDFTTMDSVQKRIAVSQMYVADVFYVYLKLRTETVGEDLPFELRCQNCKTTNSITADLTTIDVSCADSLDDLDWDFELSTPISIRGKETKKLKLGALLWNTYESLTEDHSNEGELINFLLTSSIKGSEHEKDLILMDGDIDEMVRKDYSNLSGEMTDNGFGPDMYVESNCKKCKKELTFRIKWESGSFFDDSSQ